MKRTTVRPVPIPLGPLGLLGLAGLLGAPAAAAPPAPGDLTVFVGVPGSPGIVVVGDELGAGALEVPAGLQGIRLLPLDFTGRVQLDALDPAKPRLRDDVPGASRVQLPAGRGSLYRFDRDGGGGTRSYGFFAVGADGRAALALELPGTGPAGDVDPFVGRVAIAPAGDAFLVATTPDAGGDLYEVDLALGTAVNRTGAHAPLAFQDGGLALLPSFGVGVAASGIVRFDRIPGASASDLPFPGGTPAHFGDGLATSGDRLTVAAIAGAAPNAADVWVFGAAGAPVPVTPAPATIPSAGYQPERLDGPYLALSQDGALCAWRTEEPKPGGPPGAVTHEAWLRPTGIAPPAPVQLSGDTFFTDTLDEAGLFSFLVTGELLFGIGETAGPAGGLESMDLHRAVLDAQGGVTFVNATLTSGDATAPFLAKPTIDPSSTVRVPGTDRFLLHDGKNDLLWAVDGAAGSATPLLDLVKSLDAHEPAGADCLLSILRDAPLDRREVQRFSLQSGVLTPLLQLPANASVVRPATPGDGTIGFVVTVGGLEWLARANLASGSVESLFPLPVPFGPSLAVTSAGSLGFSVGAAGAPALHLAWQKNGGLGLMKIPLFPGFLLPGA